MLLDDAAASAPASCLHAMLLDAAAAAAPMGPPCFRRSRPPHSLLLDCSGLLLFRRSRRRGDL